MKAKAISFTSEVLKAKLRALEQYGQVQTRRPIKPQPSGIVYADRYPARAEIVVGGCGAGWRNVVAPYGVGQVLWVRESARVVAWRGFRECFLRYEMDGAESDWMPFPGRLKGGENELRGRLLPNGVFREGARHFLEVVDIRAERLHAVTEKDARLEGFERRLHFLKAFDSIYGEDFTLKDPWVFIYTLKKMAKP